MYIHSISLSETARALKSGELDIAMYINETCDRIDENEPFLKALLPEPKRRERLLNEAKQLERRFPQKDQRPPLYGILVGVKDIFNVDGFLTRAGSKLPPELFAGEEAISVKKLKEAGALILGKTVTTEFAYFTPGPTRNPYNLEHTPGGSSSGSAAAVAAGFCPLALGTQTIGSVIRPAAFCGIVGFKPSFDRIPTEGLVYFSITSDHVGLFTQDVAGMSLVSSILCNDWQDISRIYLKKPVLGIPEGPYLGQASEEALFAFEMQIRKLESAGYEVKRVHTFQNIEDINERHRKLGAKEMSLLHAQWFTKYKNHYSQHTVEVFEKGEKIPDEELEFLRKKGKELREELQNTMLEKSIDLWVSPSATGPAPKGIDSTGNPIMNLPWTHAGVPVINIPVGLDKKSGLPLGLQLSAPYMKDEMLLAWAKEIAEVFA
jgi:Asp-tRNA(Asn)/Glu-tRNA(Gln) amidotransferase A subunit family amidase